MTVMVVDRDWHLIFETMVKEGLISTTATPSYRAIGTEYSPGKRLAGTSHFYGKWSPSQSPMICWHLIRSTSRGFYTCQRFRTDLHGRIRIAMHGGEDTDNASYSVPSQIQDDLANIQEAFMRHPSLSGLSQGPFGVKSRSVVQGQGTTGTLIGVLPIEFGEVTVGQNTTPGHRDNLGPTTWIGELPFMIPVLHT